MRLPPHFNAEFRETNQEWFYKHIYPKDVIIPRELISFDNAAHTSTVIYTNRQGQWLAKVVDSMISKRHYPTRYYQFVQEWIE